MISTTCIAITLIFGYAKVDQHGLLWEKLIGEPIEFHFSVNQNITIKHKVFKWYKNKQKPKIIIQKNLKKKKEKMVVIVVYLND